jgi:uncharacterized repeat protein (TIGR01451 family)
MPATLPPSATALPAPSVDLGITAFATPAPATRGRDVTWRMLVTNNGPDEATGVTVGDPLPVGSSFVAAFPSQGICTGGLVVDCDLGTVPNGGSVTITLVTTARVTGRLTNTAMVVGNERETNTADNSTTATDDANAFTPPAVRPARCTAVEVTPRQRGAGRAIVPALVVVQHGRQVPGLRVEAVGGTLRLVVGRTATSEVILPPAAARRGVVVTRLQERREWVVRYAGSRDVVLSTRESAGDGVLRVSIRPRQAGAVTLVPLPSQTCTKLRTGVNGGLAPTGEG